jgi:hypothetical protein
VRYSQSVNPIHCRRDSFPVKRVRDYLICQKVCLNHARNLRNVAAANLRMAGCVKSPKLPFGVESSRGRLYRGQR